MKKKKKRSKKKTFENSLDLGAKNNTTNLLLENKLITNKDAKNTEVDWDKLNQIN